MIVRRLAAFWLEEDLGELLDLVTVVDLLGLSFETSTSPPCNKSFPESM
jgi:hypothetical protein